MVRSMTRYYATLSAADTEVRVSYVERQAAAKKAGSICSYPVRTILCRLQRHRSVGAVYFSTDQKTRNPTPHTSSCFRESRHEIFCNCKSIPALSSNGYWSPCCICIRSRRYTREPCLLTIYTIKDTDQTRVIHIGDGRGC